MAKMPESEREKAQNHIGQFEGLSARDISEVIPLKIEKISTGCCILPGDLVLVLSNNVFAYFSKSS